MFPFIIAALMLFMLYSVISLNQIHVALSEPEEQSYTVTWSYNGEELSKQEFTQGDIIELPDVTIPGYRVYSWVDSSGSEFLQGSSVKSDISYSAYVLPALNNHVPYLFVNEDGFLQPLSPITGNQIASAISVLISPDYPGKIVLPSESEIVSVDELNKVLSQFYTDEEIDNTLASFDFNGTITRQDFCALLNKLTGRASSEGAVLLDNSIAPADVTEKDKYRLDLLEASVEHIHSGTGDTLEDILIPSNKEPGFFWIDGWLFCCDDNGYLYKDCTEDGLYYDETGRYTCGNYKLDQLVVDELLPILDENSSAERLELLRALYEHFRHDFRYLGRHTVAYEGEPWEADAAIIFLEKRSGDCRNYAAAFTAMARGLGYPAITHVRNDKSSHSWTEITIDGTPYVFDPQLASVKHDDRFMLPYTPGHYLLPSEVENGGEDDLSNDNGDT